MPVGNYLFTRWKSLWFAPQGMPAPGPQWDQFGGGLNTGNPGISEFRMLLVCNGGAAAPGGNGLNVADAEDVVFVSNSPLNVIAHQFDGAGYNTVQGEPVVMREVEVDDATDQVWLKGQTIELGSVQAPTAGANLTITDVVMYLRLGGATMGLPVARWDFSAAPITPDGRGLNIVLPAIGPMYVA